MAVEARAWSDFAAASPSLARRGRERLERAGVALLGTVRKGGAPRISPIEPVFTGDHLLIGVMPWSLKARDLVRDPRCVLHSAVGALDAGESEFKLYGRALEVDDELRDARADAWWASRPRGDARVLSLAVERAVLVEWDLGRGEMTLTRWSPGLGTSRVRREYP
ncbi:MAG: pyridoxamine 5'-phosphate oxidase family protein [Gaiellaceae bacterium]